MHNKSKNTAFSTVNVDELLGKEPETEQEVLEPAPVIEKVSLKDIKEEQNSSNLTEALELINRYLSLSPEERKSVDDALFE